MKYVIVSVTNDLVTDQRVHRTCKTLNEMGFQVVLIGRKLSHSPSVKRTYKTIRMRLLFNNGFCFYAGYNLKLFFRLLFIRKDILLANDLDTLLPNFLISKLFRKKMVFDSHELFSEIPELIGRKRVQSIWLQLERFLIPKVKNGLATSESIANYYNQQYGVTFEVIRNIPDRRKSTIQEFSFPVNGKSVILYQGALNMGRGLELMIDAMQYVENAIFIVIGAGDIGQQLKEKVDTLNLNEKVRFLGRRSPEELSGLTPGADLGISLEEDLGLNYRYALPNKLFDYIAAKIPVLVSDLPEMREIVKKYHVGEVLKNRTPEALARIVTEMLNVGKKNWEKQLEQASGELTWENESEKLRTVFGNLIENFE